MGYRDVLRHGASYLDTHSVLHLLLDALAVGQDQDDVDADEYKHDADDKLGTHGIGALNVLILNVDVLLVEVFDADVGQVDQRGADIVKDVLWGDIAAEGNSIDGKGWPVKRSIVFPSLRVVPQNAVVDCGAI